LVLERPTPSSLLEFLNSRPWKPTTKFTAAVTIIEELRRRQTPMTGDTAGLVRLLKQQLLAFKPSRAVMATTDDVTAIVKSAPTTELKALVILLFSFAARLTSIIKVVRNDIHLHLLPAQEGGLLTVTFRAGKTIISTGV
jgi:hypothetical protein